MTCVSECDALLTADVICVTRICDMCCSHISCAHMRIFVCICVALRCAHMCCAQNSTAAAKPARVVSVGNLNRSDEWMSPGASLLSQMARDSHT